MATPAQLGITNMANTSPMDGPTQINDRVAALAAAIDPSVATASALPASGNWPGRTFYVEADGSVRMWTGAAWAALTRNLFGPGAGLVGGTPPAAAVILEQAGTITASTSAGGDVTLNYPNAFPNGVLSVRLDRYDFSVLGTTSQVLSATQTKSACVFRVYNSAGNVLASAGGLKYTYTALGW